MDQDDTRLVDRVDGATNGLEEHGDELVGGGRAWRLD